MTTYPGGKNGSGVYQTLINQMPPHQIYIEGFLGGGAIMRLKRPAPVANIGIEIDDRVAEAFAKVVDIPRLELWHASALPLLISASEARRVDTLIYLDPPYLMETRRLQRQIYRCELTEDDHRNLLGIITKLPCMVMISGYYSDMYAHALTGWRSLQYQAQVRSGATATEWLWMNYPEPFELHDYRYLGSNYRERERIKRKKNRWVERLSRTPRLERYAMLNAIQEFRGGHEHQL